MANVTDAVFGVYNMASLMSTEFACAVCHRLGEKPAD
jgi:hypothetical protein